MGAGSELRLANLLLDLGERLLDLHGVEAVHAVDDVDARVVQPVLARHHGIAVHAPRLHCQRALMMRVQLKREHTQLLRSGAALKSLQSCSQQRHTAGGCSAIFAQARCMQRE